MAEVGTVNSLVAELLTNSHAKANHTVKLLALMMTCKQEAALKTAIQGLKQFFVAAGQDGLLTGSAGVPAGPPASRPVKRQKVAAAPAAVAGRDGAADAAAPRTDAEAQYREWMGRQYAIFVGQLLSLATGATQQPQVAPPRSAGVQVVAAAALMECVRSELGPGVFSGSLYGRLLSGVLLSPGARPEVFALLFTKYLALADVRFHTLATVRALVIKYGSKVAHGPAGGEDASYEGEADVTEAAAAAAAASGDSGALSLPDLARNVYDVLCRVEATLPADPSEWTTWCGGTEYNMVTATADKNESSRLRRKRKQQEQQQQDKKHQPREQQQQQQQQRVQWANATTQRRLYSDAWLALLALPLPRDVLRKALVRLPTYVIPHMTGPQLLADFLTHCLNGGGLTGMLALNGLFLLVTRHGLEYPHFFARLYQLLVPEAFAARSRAQFFRLADIFLTSSLVPAYTVAAFVKRFARLALTAPPAGAMIAIALVHNLIRRHPALVRMLHNPVAAAPGAAPHDGAGCGGVAEAAGSKVDPYDLAEPDPAKSRAVESSLWELEALRNNYCPQVSTFCAVLDKDLTNRAKTAEVNLEDLLGAATHEGQQPGGAGSYNALIRGELARKLRKVPVAFYAQPPASLFFATGDASDWGGWSLEPEATR